MAFACNSSGVMTILAGKNDKSVVKIISSEDHPICYEEVNGETVDPFKIDADTLEGKSVQDIVKLVPNPDLSGYAKSTEVESLKTSVSEGKKLVAAAVTDKGVQTAADASFTTIRDNVISLNTKNSIESSILKNTKLSLSSGSLKVSKYSASANRLYYLDTNVDQVRYLDFGIHPNGSSNAEGFCILNSDFSGNYLGNGTQLQIYIDSIDITSGVFTLHIGWSSYSIGYLSNLSVSGYRAKDGLHITYSATYSSVVDSRRTYPLYSDEARTKPNPTVTVECVLTGTLTASASAVSDIDLSLS